MTTSASAPLLTDLLESWARRRPSAAALDDGTARLSYGRLARRVQDLAGALAAHALQPEALVAVALGRSLDLVVAFLATLRAGAAWLPLDPAYPRDRLAFMLADARPALLLTERALLPGLPEADLPTLQLAQLDQPGAPLPPLPLASSLAYLLYTSGSTGQPKGVLVEHRGIGNLAAAQSEFFALGPESRVLQFASPNFDAFVSEVAMALHAGACLHLAERDALLPGAALAGTLRQRDITHVTLPPSALAVMDPASVPRAMTLAVAGEACSAELLRRWGPGRRFINAYGPTEATVCATMELCDPGEPGPPSIGRAMRGARVLLLDAAGTPVAPGETGEIHVGGVGLARGYLRRPDLTAARFIADPQQPGERLYRTGDLGRQRPDGRFDFLGRIDHQVKIRGYRVEPGEIEAALAEHPGLAAVAVVPEETAGGKRLVACFVARGAAPTPGALRSFLLARLPPWLVPARWVALARLPLTPSGKVDRNALPPPEAPAAAAAAAAPRDPVEQRVLLLWEEVLGRSGLGVADDFFEVGGDSLRAVQLLARLAAAFGRHLSPALMAREPTVAALAQALRAEGSATWSPLVPLSPGVDAPPLICVHPAGGTVICYRALAAALPGSRPVWGLQAYGYDPGQQPDLSVEAQAQRYVAAVTEAAPEGPLALAGWSFGAVVALEMAQQLRRAGRTVSQLIALDATLQPDLAEEGEDDIVLRLVRLYSYLQDRDPYAVPEARDLDGAEARIARLVAHAAAAGIFPPDFDLQQGRRLAAVTGGCFQAGRAYRPQPWQGRLILIRASRVLRPVDDPSLGWSAIAGTGLELIWTPGDHLSMIRPPDVAGLAQRIEAILGARPLSGFSQPAA